MTDGARVGVPWRAVALSLLAWAIPTSGHLLLGRRGRAAIFAVLLIVAVGVGLHFEGNLHRVVPGQPLTLLFTLGAMGLGAPYFVLRYLLGYHGTPAEAGFEYGTVFLLSAGLMNLLLALDVCGVRALGGVCGG